MLEVRVIKKFYDKDGKLIGYRLKDTSGNIKDVYKDMLKQAVKSGQCVVVNMTMTSDGRLIGKAGEKPKNRVGKPAEPVKPIVNILQVYTNGKKISAAMVQDQGLTESVAGLNPNTGFDVGHEVMKNIENGWYSNAKFVDGKIVGDIKKKPFKTVRNKLLKILEQNGVKPEFTVEKTETKFEYAIVNHSYCGNSILNQIVNCLICDTLITNKAYILYIDGDKFYTKCTAGIADLRKVVKQITKAE